MRPTIRNLRMSSTKNREKRGQKFMIIGACVAAGFLVGLLIAVNYFSFFPLKKTVFYGNRNLSDAELRRLMGLAENEDLLHLDLDDLGASLQRSPWIIDAGIRKQYPGTLLVKVTESEPYAVLDRGGLKYLIDRSGKILETAGIRPSEALPLIKLRPESDRQTLEEAVKLVAAISTSGMGGDGIFVDGTSGGKEELTIHVGETAVKIGAGEYAEKLARFNELFTEIRSRWAKVDYIDLRFDDRVVVRPAKEEAVN